MTDIENGLAKRLFDRIEWQYVPDAIGREDMCKMIADAIRMLYVMTGRAAQFSEDMFSLDEEGNYLTFSETLELDEAEWVLLTAEIAFYKKAQSSVSFLVSYTTDAMSVSHGDKPYVNLTQKIGSLESDQRRVWYKMIQYHLL